MRSRRESWPLWAWVALLAIPAWSADAPSTAPAQLSPKAREGIGVAFFNSNFPKCPFKPGDTQQAQTGAQLLGRVSQTLGDLAAAQGACKPLQDLLSSSSTSRLALDKAIQNYVAATGATNPGIVLQPGTNAVLVGNDFGTTFQITCTNYRRILSAEYKDAVRTLELNFKPTSSSRYAPCFEGNLDQNAQLDCMQGRLGLAMEDYGRRCEAVDKELSRSQIADVQGQLISQLSNIGTSLSALPEECLKSPSLVNYLLKASVEISSAMFALQPAAGAAGVGIAMAGSMVANLIDRIFVDETSAKEFMKELEKIDKFEAYACLFLDTQVYLLQCEDFEKGAENAAVTDFDILPNNCSGGNRYDHVLRAIQLSSIKEALDGIRKKVGEDTDETKKLESAQLDKLSSALDEPLFGGDTNLRSYLGSVAANLKSADLNSLALPDGETGLQAVDKVNQQGESLEKFLALQRDYEKAKRAYAIRRGSKLKPSDGDLSMEDVQKKPVGELKADQEKARQALLDSLRKSDSDLSGALMDLDQLILTNWRVSQIVRAGKPGVEDPAAQGVIQFEKMARARLKFQNLMSEIRADAARVGRPDGTKSRVNRALTGLVTNVKAKFLEEVDRQRNQIRDNIPAYFEPNGELSRDAFARTNAFDYLAPLIKSCTLGAGMFFYGKGTAVKEAQKDSLNNITSGDPEYSKNCALLRCGPAPWDPQKRYGVRAFDPDPSQSRSVEYRKHQCTLNHEYQSTMSRFYDEITKYGTVCGKSLHAFCQDGDCLKGRR